nr:MAG TPA_asm: hypothetical protein [Caudoviricetes sp.]
MNRKLMSEASRFQSSSERASFWKWIIGTLSVALILSVIFNLF